MKGKRFCACCHSEVEHWEKVYIYSVYENDVDEARERLNKAVGRAK